MTFVIGFHCLDGLVLCADSEESDGNNKKWVDKLYCQKFPDSWEVCFGGAGDAVAIDKFKSKFFPILSTEPTDDAVKIELTTEKVLNYMHQQYANGGFEILLGYSNLASKDTLLYRGYENYSTLRPI